MKQKYNENSQSKWLQGLRHDEQSAKINNFMGVPAVLQTPFIDCGSIKQTCLYDAPSPWVGYCLCSIATKKGFTYRRMSSVSVV